MHIGKHSEFFLSRESSRSWIDFFAVFVLGIESHKDASLWFAYVNEAYSYTKL